MNERIDILEIRIDNFTAKEAMKKMTEYMQTDVLNAVEIITADVLMLAKEMPELKEQMEGFDMVVPGDETILEVAGIIDNRRLQEIQKNLFLKMFKRYLHKCQSRIFILAESIEDIDMISSHLVTGYKEIVIAGSAVVLKGSESDDMLVNSINGAEVDCVMAVLDSPLKERFITRNRTVLNTKVWLGIGRTVKIQHATRMTTGRMKEFIRKQVFKRQIEKHKKES